MSLGHFGCVARTGAGRTEQVGASLGGGAQGLVGVRGVTGEPWVPCGRSDFWDMPGVEGCCTGQGVLAVLGCWAL